MDRLLDDDTHRPRAVALSGLAGVGKTELALELAYRRHREGRVAWWIVADDPAGTASGLADLAAAAGITQYERERGHPGGALGASWTATRAGCWSSTTPTSRASWSRSCRRPSTAT